MNGLCLFIDSASKHLKCLCLLRLIRAIAAHVATDIRTFQWVVITENGSTMQTNGTFHSLISSLFFAFGKLFLEHFLQRSKMFFY